jgi:hypothetical protein
MAHENPVNEVLINKISKSMKVADSNKSTFIKEGQNMYRNANVEIIEFGKSKLMNEIQDRAEKVGKKELLKTWTKGVINYVELVLVVVKAIIWLISIEMDMICIHYSQKLLENVINVETN